MTVEKKGLPRQGHTLCKDLSRECPSPFRHGLRPQSSGNSGRAGTLGSSTHSVGDFSPLPAPLDSVYSGMRRGQKLDEITF